MTRALVPTGLLVLAALTAVGATAQQVLTVTQKRRTFTPKEVTIDAGSTVLFVNDDGELLHHVFARNPQFSFDLGEQPAGSQTLVRFTTRGTFQVRCEIHPRMQLDVTVR
jgi:plastocyanin